MNIQKLCLPCLFLVSTDLCAGLNVWMSGDIIVVNDMDDSIGIERDFASIPESGWRDIPVQRRWINRLWNLLRVKFPDDLQDDYDFVSLFVDTTEGSGFPRGRRGGHDSIYNTITGIGQDTNPERPDSFYSGRLLGGSGFFEVPPVSTLLHETMHQWCCEGVNYRDDDGETRYYLHDDGWDRDEGHFVTGLDTKTGALGGSDWRESPDRSGWYWRYPTNDLQYSPLEKYLMGLIPATDVLPFRILLDHGFPPGGGSYDPGHLYHPSDIKRAGIENIIGEIGMRDPDYRKSQRIFHEVFIVITKNTDRDNLYISRVNERRLEYEMAFRRATNALAMVDTTRLDSSFDGYGLYLYISDGLLEPSTPPTGVLDWRHSPDIWVRHVNDGEPGHQTPKPGSYINVKVHNSGRHTYGNVRVNVYLADYESGTDAPEFEYPSSFDPDKLIGSGVIRSVPPCETTGGFPERECGVATVAIEWPAALFPAATSGREYSLLVEILPMNAAWTGPQKIKQNNKVAQRDIDLSE